MDLAVLQFFQEHVKPGFLTDFMNFYTHLGEAGILWIALTLALMIHPKTRKAALAAALSLIVMAVLNNIVLKSLIARPRPYTTYPELVILIKKLSSFSFPSGHTSSAFAVVTAVSLHHRRASWVLFPAAILMGVSRIYFSVHYCTDVLGGAVAGVLYAVVGLFAAHLIWKRWGGPLTAIGSKKPRER